MLGISQFGHTARICPCTNTGGSYQHTVISPSIFSFLLDWETLGLCFSETFRSQTQNFQCKNRMNSSCANFLPPVKRAHLDPEKMNLWQPTNPWLDSEQIINSTVNQTNRHMRPSILSFLLGSETRVPLSPKLSEAKWQKLPEEKAQNLLMQTFLHTVKITHSSHERNLWQSCPCWVYNILTTNPWARFRTYQQEKTKTIPNSWMQMQTDDSKTIEDHATFSIVLHQSYQLFQSSIWSGMLFNWQIHKSQTMCCNDRSIATECYSSRS